MNYELFLSNYLRAIFSPEGDDVYAAIKVATGGLSSPRMGKLINLAASCMDSGERYVETGVFTGFTLICAGHDNQALTLGIDNFDVKGPESSVGCDMDEAKIRSILKGNCERFGVKGHVVEADFRKVNLETIKTGVTFIDARHDYASVTDNIQWIEPSLAKDAILLFDDLDCEGVPEAILDAVTNRNYELLYFSKSKNKMHRTATYDKTFVNGLAVVHYEGPNGL